MLDAMIASALKRLLDKHVLLRKRASVEEQLAHKYDRFFYEGGKLLTRSTSIFVQPELMKQYKDFQICPT